MLSTQLAGSSFENGLQDMKIGQLVMMMQLAAVVVSGYDHLLTLGGEIEYIWPMPHTSFVKWLYLLLRYVSLSVQIAVLFHGTDIGIRTGISTAPFCKGWFVFESVALQLLVNCVHFVLITRVYALHNRSRTIFALLVFCVVAENASMIYVWILTLPKVHWTSTCIPAYVPPETNWFGFGPCCFEVILLLLTIRKSLQASSVGWRHTPLLMLLVRDGIWAFLVIFLTFLVVMIQNSASSGGTSALLLCWYYTLPPSVACRLVLNLHSFSAPDIALRRATPHNQQFRLEPGSSGTRNRADMSVDPRSTILAHPEPNPTFTSFIGCDEDNEDIELAPVADADEAELQKDRKLREAA